MFCDTRQMPYKSTRPGAQRGQSSPWPELERQIEIFFRLAGKFHIYFDDLYSWLYIYIYMCVCVCFFPQVETYIIRTSRQGLPGPWYTQRWSCLRWDHGLMSQGSQGSQGNGIAMNFDERLKKW